MPQHFANGALHLEHGKLLANAVARTRREGCVGKDIDVAVVLGTKALRIEFLRLGEKLGIALCIIDEQDDVCAGGETLAICVGERI